MKAMRSDDVDTPQPGAGEVRVRVAATTFNGIDATIRAGAMQGPFPVALPHVPGVEVAGTVDALGTGVEGLAVGDPVVGFLPMVADGAAAGSQAARDAGREAAPQASGMVDARALGHVRSKR